MKEQTSTAILVLFLLALVFLAVRSYLKRLSRGGCGSGNGERLKKVPVQDRDRSHYPYLMCFTVDGMVCGNCASRVENALNSIDGVWAEADVSGKKVTIRMKTQIPAQILRDTVNQIGGYTVLQKTDFVKE